MQKCHGGNSGRQDGAGDSWLALWASAKRKRPERVFQVEETTISKGQEHITRGEKCIQEQREAGWNKKGRAREGVVVKKCQRGGPGLKQGYMCHSEECGAPSAELGQFSKIKRG